MSTRALAGQALARWPLRVDRWRHVPGTENTCWRLAGRLGRSRTAAPFLLRVHDPRIQDGATVPGELHWLAALRRDTDAWVPEPIPTRSGAPCAQVLDAATGAPRVVSLLRWIPGRHGWRHKHLHHCEQLGRLQATLHAHARTYRAPSRHRRRAWDWDGLYRDVLSRLPGRRTAAPDLAALAPADRQMVRRGLARVRRVLDGLGRGRRAWGQIHADLHFGNVVFAGGRAAAFDFDDSGPGHFLTDCAITLWGPWTERGFPPRLAAWRAGYESVQPAPAGFDEHLDTLLRARTLRLVARSCAHLRAATPRAKHARSVFRWALPRLRRWLGSGS